MYILQSLNIAIIAKAKSYLGKEDQKYWEGSLKQGLHGGLSRKVKFESRREGRGESV